MEAFLSAVACEQKIGRHKKGLDGIADILPWYRVSGLGTALSWMYPRR